MSFAVCVFITWSVILILSVIPKKLSEQEMIFLFFVDTIFELSIFTVFHLNFHWMLVSHSVEKSISDLVIRLVWVPVMLVIASNVSLYSSRFFRWGIVVAVVLSGIAIQKVQEWLGILTTPHWNVVYTALMFFSYVAFSRLMTWFIQRIVFPLPQNVRKMTELPVTI